MLSTIMFLNSPKFNRSLSSTVKTILVCRYNDVTLIDVELHGKGRQIVKILTILHASFSPALTWKILCI